MSVELPFLSAKYNIVNLYLVFLQNKKKKKGLATLLPVQSLMHLPFSRDTESSVVGFSFS